MARVPDLSVYDQVKAPNLSQFADSYMEGAKFAEDLRNSRQTRGAREREDARQAAEAAQKTTQFTGEEQARIAKREEDRHAHINQFLGREAEFLKSFPPEKQKEIYDTHSKKGMHDAGIDVTDIPEYDPALLNAWTQNAMDPGERSAERMAKDKYAYLDNNPGYTRGVDGATGNVMYFPKIPGKGEPIATEIKAPPQVGVFQGPNGPQVYNAPKVVGQPATGAPILDPQGTPIGQPLKPVPTEARKAILSNYNAIRHVDDIVKGLTLPGNVPHTGPGYAVANKLPYSVGDILTNWVDPNGTKTRQLISQMSSLTMKDISGANVPPKEMARLDRWLPQVGMSGPVIKSALENWKREAQAIIEEMSSEYNNKGSGYRADPLLQEAMGGGVLPLATPQIPVGPTLPPSLPPQATVAPKDSLDLSNQDLPRALIQSDTTVPRPPGGWLPGDVHRNAQGTLVRKTVTGWEAVQ